ncbi:MAG: hypothetical protein ACFFD1_13565 [Candidatus Thorarchaeota archaeon]
MNNFISFFFPKVNFAPDDLPSSKKLLLTFLFAIIFSFFSIIPMSFVLNNLNFNLFQSLPFPRYYYNVFYGLFDFTFASLTGSLLLALGLSWFTLVLFRHYKGSSLFIKSYEDFNNLNDIYKSLSIIFTIFIQCAYVVIGYYGNQLNLLAIILIVFVSLIIIWVFLYFDERLKKGWGYSNGFSLYLFISISENLLYNLGSFANFADGIIEIPNLNQLLPIGVINALFTAMLQNGIINGFIEIFFRINHPRNSVFSVILILGMVFILLWKKDIFSKQPNLKTDISYKLKNEFNLINKTIDPLFFALLCLNILYLVSFVFANILPDFLFTQWLGQFDPASKTPTAGVVFYFNPEKRIIYTIMNESFSFVLSEIIIDLIKLIIFVIFFVFFIKVFLLLNAYTKHIDPSIASLSSDEQNKDYQDFSINQWTIIVTTFYLLDTFGIISGAIFVFIFVLLSKELYNKFSFDNIPIKSKFIYLFFLVIIGYLFIIFGGSIISVYTQSTSIGINTFFN